MKTPAVALVILLVASPAPAQYWGEQVLEKSFEQTEFFFTPSYLNPYGIGTFDRATPGLLADPLLDFIVNPARIDLDSLRWGYLYTDFRTARTVAEEPVYYPLPYYDGVRAAIDPYPRFYLNTRRELEPVFSGALFGRPFREAIHGLLVGLTYQVVLQDDKYYGIPQDIYRMAAGYDYGGERAAAADALPVVDRYSGTDNISQEGHFLNTFARYTLPIGMELAARLGRVTFEREGSLGSANLWQYSSAGTGSSLWSNLEERAQDYEHWDLSGGIRYRVSPELTVGAMAGYLWGEAVQGLGRGDSSYLASAYQSGSSYYDRSGRTVQGWTHDGRTTYWGADLTARPSPTATVTVLYRRESAGVEIALRSSIRDTSYSRYSWTDQAGTVISYSESYLNDARSGAGRQDRTTDRITGSLRWEINDRVRLSIGAILEWQTSETGTTEEVLLASRSAYWSSSGTWDSRHTRDEHKWLDWTFSAERRSFRIPVFVTVRASEVIEVLLGLNRDMAQWKIRDVTLARFAFRESSSNGTVERNENFGERYSMPVEQVTDVRTAFLAGLSLHVSRAFSVRMLMVPSFQDTYDGTELQDLQWWLGLSLTP